MSSRTTIGKKSVVSELNFGAKTAKRVAWEAWEFTVVGPCQVEVTNASYGYLKDDHSYVVTVGEEGGRALPLTCECKADQYSDEYDCKHKVALASVGGPIVMEAAIEYESLEKLERSEQVAGAELLRADGGSKAETNYCDCDCFSEDDLPCWPCYNAGK